MTTLAGRDCTIKTGLTPVAMTGEATTANGPRTVYTITSAAKRAIDPETAITVYDDGSPVTSTDYAVSYADGTITFSVARTLGHTVTVDAKYVPLSAALSARSAEVTLPQPQMADATLLGDAAARQVEIAKRCMVSLTHIHDPSEDLDTGGGTMLVSTVMGAARVFLEVKLSTSQTVRGWFTPSPAQTTHKLDSLMDTQLVLVGVVQTPVGRPSTDQALFSLT